jgi:hypothetical protein
MATRSEKPLVIEHIFKSRWNQIDNTLSSTLVTNNDIVAAIAWAANNHGTVLSSNNPANFIKDLIRGNKSSAMWPDLLKKHRWSAVQVTGGGNVFEFVPYLVNQNEPFPIRFGYHPSVQKHRLQSVSIPLATKELGRDDETYLIQVAVKLYLVETHFALFSPLKVRELNHLQIGIKLRLCEVDSLYSAAYENDEGNFSRLIITTEAKKRNQRIIEEQIVQQVHATFNATKVDLVVPTAMTSIDHGIYFVEFKPVRRIDLLSFDTSTLQLQTEVFYELVPRINGV